MPRLGTSKDVGISDGYPWFNVDPIMVHNGLIMVKNGLITIVTMVHNGLIIGKTIYQLVQDSFYPQYDQ